MLRYLFNIGQYEARVQSGDLFREPTERYRTPTRRGQPRGTISARYRYKNQNGMVIAIAFHHLRHDGSYRPDPKWLRDGNEALVPGHDDIDECPDCGRYRELCRGLLGGGDADA